MKDTRGNPLYKRIHFKVFSPGNRKFVRECFRAPSGKGFHEGGIEEAIRKIAKNIEQQFPHLEYNLVPTGPNSFNFVCAGEKQQIA